MSEDRAEGLGTGRQVLAVPGRTGVPVGGAGAGSRAAWTLCAHTDVLNLMTTSSPAVGCARILFSANGVCCTC